MRKQSAPPSTYTSACHEVGGEAALRRLIGRAAMVGSARLLELPRFRGHGCYAAGAGEVCWRS
jgi:hypothetical protein